jgi:hypothetical protein
MPGRWEQYQNLNAGRVEWPTGPLDTEGETPIWLEAWVVQRSTGASQRTVDTTFGVPGHWTASGTPSLQGQFQPGSATGIALVALHNTASNKDEFYWWVDDITLALGVAKGS